MKKIILKQREVNVIYNNLNSIMKLNLPISKSRAIYNIYLKLKDTYEFGGREEFKCLELFKGEVLPDSSLKFETPEVRIEFQKAYDIILNLETELEIDEVTISDEDLEGQRISASDINNLSKIITFR